MKNKALADLLLHKKIEMLCRKRKREMVDPVVAETTIRSSADPRVNSTISTTPLYENKEFLQEKYCTEKLSARQIAVLIGCAHSTINEALERHGIVKSKRVSGHVPYGSKLFNGKVVPYVREQQVLEQIRLRHERGWSGVRIATWLNGKGLPSPDGVRWWPATVRRLLKGLDKKSSNL